MLSGCCLVLLGEEADAKAKARVKSADAAGFLLLSRRSTCGSLGYTITHMAETHQLDGNGSRPACL